MPERIPQSVARRVVAKAYLASDHVSAATSKTIAVTISKNGGGFANPAAGATNMTEIGSGWYYVDLGTGDTDTLGPLVMRGAVATVDDVELVWQVANPNNAGFAGIPAAAAEAAGGLYTRGTGAGQINQPANGQIDTALKAILGTTLTETSAGYLAAAFKKLFDVATPVLTAASVNQTIDNPTAAAIAALILATPANKLVTDGSGKVSVLTNDDKSGYTISGTKTTLDSLNDLNAAAVRTAIGLATANLDSQIATLALEATLTAMKGASWSTETLKAIKDAIPAAGPSASDIKTALEADGSKLDHLWEMTEDDGGVRRLTTNALEQAPTGSGTGLTAQQTRDAMKLAPTPGAPAAGSIDAHLDVLPSAAAGLQNGLPTLDANLLVNADLERVMGAVPSGDVPDVNVTKVGGTPVTGPDDLKADVSNLDVAVSTRATPAQVLAQVEAALDAEIPASPTADSINERIKTVDDLLADTTDGVAAIRDVVDAIKLQTDNLPARPKKGAQLANFPFVMIDSADDVSAMTELTVTGQISKDGASFASLTNAVSEIAGGVYKVTLTATEMNADTVTLKFSGTGANDRFVTILTSP